MAGDFNSTANTLAAGAISNDFCVFLFEHSLEQLPGLFVRTSLPTGMVLLIVVIITLTFNLNYYVRMIMNCFLRTFHQVFILPEH